MLLKRLYFSEGRPLLQTTEDSFAVNIDKDEENETKSENSISKVTFIQPFRLAIVLQNLRISRKIRDIAKHDN